MTNVNVPFGTVNWMSKGQEENKGRRGIICFTSCWTRMVEEEARQASIVDDYARKKNEIMMSICCLFCDTWFNRWICIRVCPRDGICVCDSDFKGLRRLFGPLCLSWSEVSSGAWMPNNLINSFCLDMCKICSLFDYHDDTIGGFGSRSHEA